MRFYLALLSLCCVVSVALSRTTSYPASPVSDWHAWNEKHDISSGLSTDGTVLELKLTGTDAVKDAFVTYNVPLTFKSSRKFTLSYDLWYDGDVDVAAHSVDILSDYSKNKVQDKYRMVWSCDPNVKPGPKGAAAWKTHKATFRLEEDVTDGFFTVQFVLSGKNAGDTTIRLMNIELKEKKEKNKYKFDDSSIDQWYLKTGWGDMSFLANEEMKALEVTTAAWSAGYVWFVNSEVRVNLKKGQEYTFTMEVAESAANVGSEATTGNTMTGLTVDILAEYEYYAVRNHWELDSNTWTTDGHDILRLLNTNDNIDVSPKVSSKFKTYELTFKANRNVHSGRLVLALDYATPTADGNKYYVRKIKLKGGPKDFEQPDICARDGFLGRVAKIPVSSPAKRTGGACPWDEGDLQDWSDLGLSTNGGTVTLPENTKVIVGNFGSKTFDKITVPASSELIFAHSNIDLHVKNFHVAGYLKIGSPDCPFTNQVTITFYGRKSRANEDDIGAAMGSKGMGVDGTGKIDIFGDSYRPTWSRLARTAKAGKNTIYLQQGVNWQVGQSIVIASTAVHYPQHEDEVMVIESITSKKRKVKLTKRLKHDHYAGLEYQAEVGLLSRNIRFVGDGNSETEEEMFGGHVIVKGANTRARVAGVEFSKMGQQNVRARYPIHFHLMRESADSYVKESSIVDSYFRCVVIHGTNSTLVEYNVAYNNFGSCFYLEDGVEENNQFLYNFATKTKVIGQASDCDGSGCGQGGESFVEDDTTQQPADHSATSFYATNAYNTFIGNAAVGGFAGFGFPNLPHPIGLHTNWKIEPWKRPTQIFDGNTARGQDVYFNSGGCVYTGGYLELIDDVLHWNSGRRARDTQDWDGNGVPMRFTNLNLAQCYNGQVHWGYRLDIENLEITDVRQGLQFFGEGSVINGLFTGHSKNKNYHGSSIGFEWYDTGTLTILSRVEFTNYFEVYDRVFRSLVHSDEFTPLGISATNKLTYRNIDHDIIIGHRESTTTSSTGFSVFDWDGSQTQLGGNAKNWEGQIVGSHVEWWNDGTGCGFLEEWNVWSCTLFKDTDLPRYVGALTIDTDAIVDGSSNDRLVEPEGFVAQFGYPERKNVVTRWSLDSGIQGLVNRGWYIHFEDGTPDDMTVTQFKLPADSWIIVAFAYKKGTTFTVTEIDQRGDHVDLKKTNSIASLDGYNYYFDGTYFYYKFIRKQDDRVFERDGVTLFQNCWWDCKPTRIEAHNCGASSGHCQGSTTSVPAKL
eukprot:TRINITY_DN4639_c0_g1_i1.p1 TRINITY_DN4639_c0_g1~~TRINITY_DN4639_c0_g1_i1.p1  ORF type:complete len:1262 (+),score=282.17 TRINITY_DN4639_c0_g1_i1:48-3788(+)